MATVASLAVQLVADSSRLDKGLSHAMDRLKSFSRVAIGVLGVGSIAGMIRAQVNLGDQLAKTATRTRLSVEALSRLKYAGDLADVSLESISKAAIRLNRALGDGTEATREAVAGLGLDFEDLIKMSADDRFIKVVGAIGAMANGLTQAAIGSELLGRGFADLLPLAEKGEAGIRAAGEASDKAGQTMSTTLAQGSARANDAMELLGKVGGRIGNQLIEEFIEPVAQALENAEVQISNFIEWLSRWTKTFFNFAGTGLGAAMALMQGDMETARALHESHQARRDAIWNPPKPQDAADKSGAMWGTMTRDGQTIAVPPPMAAVMAAAEDRTPRWDTLQSSRGPMSPFTANAADASLTQTNQLLRSIDTHLTQGVPARAQ